MSLNLRFIWSKVSCGQINLRSNSLFKNSNNFTKITQQKRFHNSEGKGDENIEVNFITKDGEKITLFGREGDDVMHLAQRNGIEVEGACEASLACCTCHVYVKQKFFDTLEPASEQEEDLLDMAPFLKETSRLGCQIILNKKLSGIEIKLPPATRNFYVDGAKPSHH